MENWQRQVSEDIGYIRAKVESIDKINDRLAKVEDKVSHMLGWASGAGAVLGVVGAYIKDWIFGNK